MNETAVREIRNRTAALLGEGPRSRDTIARRLLGGGCAAEDVEEALADVDWHKQAFLAAKSRAAAAEPIPADIRAALFVGGFTGDEIEAALAGLDQPAWLRTRLTALLQEEHVSRKTAQSRLEEMGFDAGAVQEALTQYDAGFWEQMALLTMEKWLDAWSSYTDFDAAGYLRRAGFEDSEIDYAVSQQSISRREMAAREAQSLYDGGMSEEAIPLALIMSRIPQAEVLFAMRNIVRSPLPDRERTIRAYLHREVRSEEGFRSALGGVSDEEWNRICEERGVRPETWIEDAREPALRRLRNWSQGRVKAREFLLKEGFSKAQVEAALPAVDWAAIASKAAQRHVDAMEVFTPAELERELVDDGFTLAEADAAVQTVNWPTYLPDDKDVAWLRRLYVKPAFREEAVECLQRCGRTDEQIAGAFERAGLDWDVQPSRIAAHLFGESLERLPATPKQTAGIIEDRCGGKVPANVAYRIGCDWKPKARRLAEEMKEQHLPADWILRRLRDDGFSAAEAAAALEDSGSRAGVLEGCAKHLREILEVTNYSRSAVEAEMAALGYSTEDVARVQEDPALDLDKVDWKRRALDWIETEGSAFSLSPGELRPYMMKEGFSVPEIDWALGELHTDTQPEETLREHGFGEAEIRSMLEEESDTL